MTSAGEQLGQLLLGAVQPESPLQQLQLFGGEVIGLEPVLHSKRRLILKLSDQVWTTGPLGTGLLLSPRELSSIAMAQPRRMELGS